MSNVSVTEIHMEFNAVNNLVSQPLFLKFV